MWLEDDLKSTAHSKRKRVVREILSQKGYEANFFEKNTFEDAKAFLGETSRIDFFISDFNLNQSETGLSYLEEIRKIRSYKQFVILYSNKTYSTLKQDVIDYFGLPSTSNLIFSNFTFFSVSGNRLIRQNFEEAINVILCRWDELNALRGQYMYENAELEYFLRKKCPDYPQDKPYRELVNSYFCDKLKFKQYKRNNNEKYRELKKILDNWLLLVDRRNALAHVTEDYDPEKGYYIQSIKDRFTIYESSLDKERCDLLEVVEMAKKVIK